MPLVNLIFEQRQFLKQQERKARMLLLGATGAAVLGVGINGILLLQGEGIRSDIAKTKQQLTRIQPIVREIETVSRQMSEMEPRLVSLEDAQKATKKWATILDHFRDVMPSGVWLTKVSSKENKDGGKVKASLTGMSLDQEGVAQFMLKLRTCTDLESVDLKYTQGEFDGSRTNIKYEIEVAIAGIGTDDKKSKDAKKKGSFSDQRSALKETS
jgi:Tfp pilus assembly protein PilN